MTRINCIDVSLLTDKHLMAEYREISRPFAKVRNHIEKGTFPNIPVDYCLGPGHETFFFDKLAWLTNRYEELCAELVNRDFHINSFFFAEILKEMKSYEGTVFWNNWHPTPEDCYLNMARLCKRSNIPSVNYELTEGW